MCLLGWLYMYYSKQILYRQLLYSRFGTTNDLHRHDLAEVCRLVRRTQISKQRQGHQMEYVARVQAGSRL